MHVRCTAGEACIGSICVWQVSHAAWGGDAKRGTANVIPSVVEGPGGVGGAPPATRSLDYARDDGSWFSSSELQRYIRERVVQRAGIFVDVLEAASGDEARDTAGDDPVVAEERAVLRAERDIRPERAMDAALEQDLFQRLDLIEPRLIDRDDRLQARRDVEIDACGDEPQSRIDVIRLSLLLAAAE